MPRTLTLGRADSLKRLKSSFKLDMTHCRDSDTPSLYEFFVA
jgi:hypothetical protein